MSAVYADGAMRGRAAVPSAAARRKDGGSPCGRAGVRPSPRFVISAAERRGLNPSAGCGIISVFSGKGRSAFEREAR